MRLQNRAAAFHVGVGDKHLAIETARPRERVVQIFRTIGRGDDHDAFAAVESVHRREQGVDGLLMFAVGIELAVLADAIDFVDENNRGLVLARLAEKLPHALGADADEHFGEITAVRAEESSRSPRRRWPWRAWSCRFRADR